MQLSNRRKFIGKLSKTALFFSVFMSNVKSSTAKNSQNLFVHHVYFWLNNPESKEDEAKLIAGLKKLSKVKTIKEFHIGKPAKTNRDVIERSYAVSWLAFFNNLEEQEMYQKDPIHLKFIAECSMLWKKVIVYDAEDIS